MFDKALYDIWRGMIGRCHSPSHISFPYYGAKGITVCESWWNSFHQFVTDMGPRPDGMSLDRIDSKLCYSKENCRWATIKQQNNNKSDTRLLTFKGETMNLSAWARKIGTSPAALHWRIAKLGMSVEDALTIPISRKNGGKAKILPIAERAIK